MWQFDFDIYYNGSLALLRGLSPYSVNGWFHPLPMALVFLPFALLPKSWAYGLYLAICGVLLWRLLKWKSAWILLSFPGFFTLFVGQVDLPMALVTSLLGHWALPLLLSRPQLAFVVAPYLIRTTPPRQLIKSAFVCALVLGVCFLIRPNWLSEWMAAGSQSITNYGRHDSSLYWLLPQHPALVAIAIISALTVLISLGIGGRRVSWTFAHLLSPVTNIYSAAALAEWFGPIEVLVSWIAILLVKGDIHSGAPMFLVGLCVLARYGLWKILKRQAT